MNQETALKKTHDVIYEKTVIEGNKDMIFTDESRFAGHIGASMASLQYGVASQPRYLGMDSQATVYDAELNDIGIALVKPIEENGYRSEQRTINGTRGDHFLLQPGCHPGSPKPTAIVWPVHAHAYIERHTGHPIEKLTVDPCTRWCGRQ